MKKTRLHFTSFPSLSMLSCVKKLLQTTGLFLILICFFQEATAQTCSPGTQTFNYTGDVQDFVIPFGINRITIAATGADGGNGASFGGSGGIISADFNVLPGDHIRIIVGGAGTQFAYGSGGGGTAVINCGGAGNCATGTLLIVAGGGGGGCGNGVPGGGATSIAGNGDGGTSLYSLSGGGGGVNGPGGFGTVGGGQASKTAISAGGIYTNSGVGGKGFGGGGGIDFGGTGGGGGYTGGMGTTGSIATTGGSNYVDVSALPGFTNNAGAAGGNGGDHTNGVVVLSYNCLNPCSCTNCRCADSLELVKLYNATDGANWTNKWNLALPMDTWYTSSLPLLPLLVNGRVTNVGLENNQLNGTIPDLNLPKLKEFILADYQLTGTIPDFNLPELQTLFITNTQVSGSIPAFNNLPMLKQLALGINQLSGPIPNFNLPNLQSLQLAGNQLSGTIPDFNLPELQTLELDVNSLTGSIPNFDLPKLRYLSLTSNQLSGPVPDLNLPALLSLNAVFNQLSGTLPVFNNLVSLTNLQLGYNQLTGSIPNYTLPDLYVIQLNDNELSGTIPAFSLSKLSALLLGNNQLSGSIPNFNLPKLQDLQINTNQLTGTIPNFNMPQLADMRLYENQLTGTIPNFSMPYLQNLQLNTNQLSGSIPAFNLPFLQSLLLNNNLLTGCIPEDIKTNSPYVEFGGDISNNPGLATQSWSDYWNNGEGVCILQTFYRDLDKDTYGDPGNSIEAFNAPDGYVTDNTDCNDDDAAINPGAAEVCDGIDNNCNGQTDEGFTNTDGDALADCVDTDDDNDGTSDVDDCAPLDATKWRTGNFYADGDGDGYGSGTAVSVCYGTNTPAGYSTLGGDCNDGNAAIKPGATEICGNGIDDNCNGSIDENCVAVCLNATSLTTTSVTATSAQLNWVASVDPVQWQVQYKTIKPGAKWIDVVVSGDKRSVTISSLLLNQNYNWHIRAKCGKNWTPYSVAISFKTLASVPLVSSRQAATTIDEGKAIQLYPNPATGKFKLLVRLAKSINANAKIELFSTSGQAVYTSSGFVSNGVLQTTIQVPITVASGMYVVKVTTANEVQQARLVYSKN